MSMRSSDSLTIPQFLYSVYFADMAELADALDLGSSGQPRAGSSPVIRIKKELHIEALFFIYSE